MFTGLVSGFQGRLPGNHSRYIPGPRGRSNFSRQRQVGFRINVGVVRRNNHLFQVGLTNQRRDEARQFLARHANRGAGIRNIVLKLRRAVHGIHRNNHGIGPQDGIVGDHILRGVLHIKQDPVTLLDPLGLQVTRHSIDFLLKPGIGHGRIVENDGIVVRVAQCRDFQVGVQTGFRQGHGFGQIFWPNLVVACKHILVLPLG